MSLSLRVQLPPSLQGGGTIAKISTSKEVLESGGEQVASLIKAHLASLPGSGTHYNPNKVSKPNVLADGQIDVQVDIPGISRAYHDIVIRPVQAQMLAIPLSAKAKGKSPRNYPGDLFMFQSKAGNLLLAEKSGRDLVLAYVLKDQVVQKQDPRLMPSDQDVLAAFRKGVEQAIDKILTT